MINHGVIYNRKYISRRTRKPKICICENKGADRTCEADHYLCFRFIYSTVHLQSKYEISRNCACAARIVSYLVENPNCCFSYAKAHYELIQFNVNRFSNMPFS